jgi:hypothetical protein
MAVSRNYHEAVTKTRCDGCDNVVNDAALSALFLMALGRPFCQRVGLLVVGYRVNDARRMPKAFGGVAETTAPISLSGRGSKRLAPGL